MLNWLLVSIIYLEYVKWQPNPSMVAYLKCLSKSRKRYGHFQKCVFITVNCCIIAHQLLVADGLQNSRFWVACLLPDIVVLQQMISPKYSGIMTNDQSKIVNSQCYNGNGWFIYSWAISAFNTENLCRIRWCCICINFCSCSK